VLTLAVSRSATSLYDLSYAGDGGGVTGDGYDVRDYCSDRISIPT
jgi:hypothetical protein